jgi:phospholipase D-like protein
MGLQAPEVLIVLFLLGGLFFWAWMLVDCVINERRATRPQIMWAVIIVFAYVPGALLYFAVRPQRRSALRR